MKLALLTDQEILAIVNPMMDNLMAGSTAINHAQHTQNFTERAKANPGEDGDRPFRKKKSKSKPSSYGAKPAKKSSGKSEAKAKDKVKKKSKPKKKKSNAKAKTE